MRCSNQNIVELENYSSFYISGLLYGLENSELLDIVRVDNCEIRGIGTKCWQTGGQKAENNHVS